jgi:peroxiredoxin
MRERLRDRAEIVGVCQCAPAQARAYAREHGFDFPVVTLDDRRSLALYRARGVPVLMAIDREGRVRHAIQGVIDRGTQVDALIAALEDQDAPPRPNAGSER